MKKIKRIIAMLCALFTMATISSCTFDFGFVDPDSSSSSKQEESSIVDITPPENNPQNSSSSDVNADMGGSEEEEVKDESYKNDPDYARYSYAPTITETMPRIQINTSDGDSSFATKYGMQDKIEGKVDYVDCTISVDKCDEEYVISEAAAEVKVRGNATLNYIKKPLRLKFKKKTFKAKTNSKGVAIFTIKKNVYKKLKTSKKYTYQVIYKNDKVKRNIRFKKYPLIR